MSVPIIQFRGVHKAFGDKKVLRGIDIDLQRGETSVLMGPSGKSVFFKLLVGLMQPDEGSILIDGEEIVGAPESRLFEVRKKIGMMFQDGALFDSMTVGENIAFPLRRHTKLPEREIAWKVDQRLTQVGLPGIEKHMPASLSGGMRKRVSLARAIIMEPEIVLFDEPNSGLDPITSDDIDSLIERTKAELGITFVIISHDIVGAFRVADWIGMLYNGELIASGAPNAVRGSTIPVVRRFLARNLELPPLPSPVSP